jgi:hypothetical protein
MRQTIQIARDVVLIWEYNTLTLQQLDPVVGVPVSTVNLSLTGGDKLAEALGEIQREDKERRFHQRRAS